MSRPQATIGKKIGRGFAVTLILIVLLTGVYQFALVSVSAGFTDLIKVEMAIAVHANAALRDLNKCRRYDKDFLLSDGSQDYVKKQADAVANLRAELDNITATAMIENKTEIIEETQKTRLLVDTYQKDFEAMIASAKEGRSDIISRLTVSAQAAEKILEDLYKSVQDEAAKQTNETTNQAKLLGGLALVVSALALISGAIMAFFLGRGISTTLNQVCQTLNEGAEQVAAAAGEVSSSSQTLAEGASQQAASVEETSASLEEVGAMVKQDADHARQADDLMKEANTVIMSADESMKKLTTSMQEISIASAQTQKIVKTIDEIAFQTNLLALNAAVEAARAGEAGAGFAVVADEVRNLAMRAAEAAKNTSNLIEGTVQKVNIGSALVKETSESFNTAAESTTRIGTIISEIAGSASQQAEAVTQVTKAIHEIDNITQGNAAAAEESAAAAEELNAQSEMMKGSVGQLLAMVGGAEGSTKARPETIKPRRPQPPTPASARKLPAPARKALPPAPKNTPAKSKKPEDIIPMDDDFADF